MDRIVANQTTGTLVLLTLGILVALLLEELLRTANTHVTAWVGARYEHELGVGALKHMMFVKLRSIEREEPVRYIDRVSASSKVAEFYSGQSLLILFDFPFILLYLWAIYLIGDWVVVAPIALLLIFTLVSIRLGQP
jgi:ABC-type bacteriocin/lantibiotic exporter with double-glycine peptidase domain